MEGDCKCKKTLCATRRCGCVKKGQRCSKNCECNAAKNCKNKFVSKKKSKKRQATSSSASSDQSKKKTSKKRQATPSSSESSESTQVSKKKSKKRKAPSPSKPSGSIQKKNIKAPSPRRSSGSIQVPKKKKTSSLSFDSSESEDKELTPGIEFLKQKGILQYNQIKFEVEVSLMRDPNKISDLVVRERYVAIRSRLIYLCQTEETHSTNIPADVHQFTSKEFPGYNPNDIFSIDILM